MTLTTNQLTDLVNEFVSIQINDMSQEDIYAYLRDIMKQDIINSNNHLTLQESLKEQIDEYDENLYDVLVPYVLDEENSHAILQEFIHDRREQW